MNERKILFSSLILFILAGCAAAASIPVSPPPVWNNLIPSQSTVEDVLNQWRDLRPNDDVSTGDQRRITFRITVGNDFAPPFKEYDLWFDHGKLQVIDMHWSNELVESGYRSLPEIVSKWGLPSIVTWNYDLYVRTAIWPDKGLMAYVRYGRAPNTSDPNVAEIWGIGFFKPVSKDQFWNSPADHLVPHENQYTLETTDAPDGEPEDPFNWDLLTSIPSTPAAQ